MPEISRFYGIIIKMFWKEPKRKSPHFHAEYSGNVVVINILDGSIIDGSIPKRALDMVLEWWSIHKEELKENWELAKNAKPINNITPLP